MKHLVIISVLAALWPISGSFAAEVDLQNAFPTLPPFFNPTNLQDPMDGTDRLFVTEQPGKIWVFDNDPSVNTRTLFLDLTAQVNSTWECGLIGLTFSPNYESTGVFYVYYTTTGALKSRLSRFTVSANPNVANPASEQILLEIPQTNFCHKSGCLAFGADGYLYLTVGDDCQGWPSQDLHELMGKMLRLDVHAPGPYTIPPHPVRRQHAGLSRSNPTVFASVALQLRPWTKRLWLGDVGGRRGRVNIVKKGRNYGWMKMEGTACYPNPAICDTAGTNAVLPIWKFPHMSEMGESITGGFVYRGHTCPGLWGKYIYADYVNAVIWALSYDGVTATNDEIYNVPPTKYLTTFGVDKDNEVYVVSIYGYIYRMIDLTTGVGDRAPAPSVLTAEPNPFQTTMTFQFDAGTPGAARIEVFDVSGRRVRVIAASDAARSVAWNGTDDQGRDLASGVYFARLVVDGRDVAHQRIVLVR
jgi:hypothetical protein